MAEHPHVQAAVYARAEPAWFTVPGLHFFNIIINDRDRPLCRGDDDDSKS